MSATIDIVQGEDKKLSMFIFEPGTTTLVDISSCSQIIAYLVSEIQDTVLHKYSLNDTENSDSASTYGAIKKGSPNNVVEIYVDREHSKDFQVGRYHVEVMCEFTKSAGEFPDDDVEVRVFQFYNNGFVLEGFGRNNPNI